MDYTSEEKANLKKISDTLNDIRDQLCELREDYAEDLFAERLFLEGLERAIASYLYEKYADEEVFDDDTYQDFTNQMHAEYDASGSDV